MTCAKPLIAVLAATIATPLWAAHANPWATPDDTVLMQYHEENLAESEDTPGEDEMLGVMTRDAIGKLVLDAGGEDGLGLNTGYSGGGAQGGGSGGAKR